MAKKIVGLIKLQIPAGKANPSPPIGPALGQRGLNIMEFCKAFNAQTQSMEPGLVLPVVITIPLQEDAGEDQAPTATVEIELPAMPAPDTVEVEPPEILAMATAVPDRGDDAPAAMLVNVPLPRAAQRPPLADKKPARNKPIATRPFGTQRRIAAQDPFGNTPPINIFNTPPDPN